MGLMDRFAQWLGLTEQRSDPVLTLDDWIGFFTFNNNAYTYQLNQTLVGDREEIAANFGGLVAGTYKRNGVVFACIQARASLLSQARFQWQEMPGGIPGDLSGGRDNRSPAFRELDLLAHPEPGKVTADLLAAASVDIDIAGNHFLTRRLVDGQLHLKRLEPHYVDIMLGSQSGPRLDGRELDAEVVGYVYYPGGKGSGLDPEFLLREEVAHIRGAVDPTARYRGMSWLTPIIREIQGDSAATTHKQNYFEKGATVNLVVQTGISDPVRFKEWVDKFREAHAGQADRTLHLSPGADATPLGSNFQEADFRAVQAAGETRIAMASGIHPVIIGASEGLQGSSLNQGNFMAARRLVADMTLRPWWGNFCASVETIIHPPAGSRLWFDEARIPFLAEDIKDAAEVAAKKATIMQILTNSGWQPDAVIEAVTANDYERLKGKHTGLFSVQLQPPGTTKPEPTNGSLTKEEADALVNPEG